MNCFELDQFWKILNNLLDKQKNLEHEEQGSGLA